MEYIYIYIYIHIHVYIYICICIRIRIHIHICICIYIYEFLWLKGHHEIYISELQYTDAVTYVDQREFFCYYILVSAVCAIELFGWHMDWHLIKKIIIIYKNNIGGVVDSQEQPSHFLSSIAVNIDFTCVKFHAILWLAVIFEIHVPQAPGRQKANRFRGQVYFIHHDKQRLKPK